MERGEGGYIYCFHVVLQSIFPSICLSMKFCFLQAYEMSCLYFLVLPQWLSFHLFQPYFAASLHILKVEIGGGSQSGSMFKQFYDHSNIY